MHFRISYPRTGSRGRDGGALKVIQEIGTPTAIMRRLLPEAESGSHHLLAGWYRMRDLLRTATNMPTSHLLLEP